MLPCLAFASVISIEDVIEELLQEEIYDEHDRREREADRIAKWASRKWKSFVKKKKRERGELAARVDGKTFADVVDKAIHKHDEETGNGTVSEETPLVADAAGGHSRKPSSRPGLFGFFGG
jgi:CBS domain containing-hemolysin-like protein